MASHLWCGRCVDFGVSSPVFFSSLEIVFYDLGTLRQYGIYYRMGIGDNLAYKMVGLSSVYFLDSGQSQLDRSNCVWAGRTWNRILAGACDGQKNRTDRTAVWKSSENNAMDVCASLLYRCHLFFESSESGEGNQYTTGIDKNMQSMLL